MNALIRRGLEERAAEGRPIRVALAGAGRFGTSIAAQISQIEGLRLVAVADPNAPNGEQALRASGWSDEQWAQADSPGAATRVAATGQAVLAPDAEAAAAVEHDVFVDATGIPEIAATNALRAMRDGRHVVMVTVEADITCGWALAQEARRQGVVYSLTAGDQPGCIMEMFDWATSLGLRVVAAGRGTDRSASDRTGSKADVFSGRGHSAEVVERRRLNAQMYNSFRDGTKAQIEMCAVSNMTGLPPDVRGMHEPSASVDELADLFALEEDGGLLSQEGVVELSNSFGPDGESKVEGAIPYGVWIVVTSDEPLVREDLVLYHLPVSKDQRRGTLYRANHLCGVETPWTIAQAALLGVGTGTSLDEPTSEVLTVAKRDLRPGDVLDGSGGENVYGLVDRAEVVASEGLLPLGLSFGVPVNRPIKAHEPVPAEAVEVPRDTVIGRLRSGVGA